MPDCFFCFQSISYRKLFSAQTSEGLVSIEIMAGKKINAIPLNN